MKSGPWSLIPIRIARVRGFMGRRSGDDVFALGVSTVGNFIEISGILAIGGFVNKTKNHVRPVCGLGPANGRIRQLPNRTTH
jgi:hypothetical protein